MKDSKVDWMQEIWIPAQIPLSQKTLSMSIWDKDKTSDEIVGTIKFDLEKYIKQAEKGEPFEFFWEDIYGAPKGVSGSNTVLMNHDPDVASTWKGRILTQVVAEKTEEPQMQVAYIPPEAVKECRAQMNQELWEVKLEVSQGICLPGKSKYRVMVKIADLELTTDKPDQVDQGYCFWNQRFKEKVWEAPYHNLEDMG